MQNSRVNIRIRKHAKECGVKLWEVAAVCGVNDGNFSRKLRKELPDHEQERILAIIDKLDRREIQEVNSCPTC